MVTAYRIDGSSSDLKGGAVAVGMTVHIRKTTRAEPHQKAIYDALGISARPGKVETTIV